MSIKSAPGNKLLAGGAVFNGPELFSPESVASVANLVQFRCGPSQSAITQDFDRGQLAASHPLSGADETFTFSAEVERTLTVIFGCELNEEAFELNQETIGLFEMSQWLREGNLLLDFVGDCENVFTPLQQFEPPSSARIVDFYRSQSSFMIGSVFYS